MLHRSQQDPKPKLKKKKDCSYQNYYWNNDQLKKKSGLIPHWNKGQLLKNYQSKSRKSKFLKSKWCIYPFSSQKSLHTHLEVILKKKLKIMQNPWNKYVLASINRYRTSTRKLDKQSFKHHKILTWKHVTQIPRRSKPKLKLKNRIVPIKTITVIMI